MHTIVSERRDHCGRCSGRGGTQGTNAGRICHFTYLGSLHTGANALIKSALVKVKEATIGPLKGGPQQLFCGRKLLL